MAGHNFDRARALARWPVAELLLAYLETAREQLREDLRHRQLMFQVAIVWGGSKDLKPPEIPKLLREPAA